MQSQQKEFEPYEKKDEKKSVFKGRLKKVDFKEIGQQSSQILFLVNVVYEYLGQYEETSLHRELLNALPYEVITGVDPLHEMPLE